MKTNVNLKNAEMQSVAESKNHSKKLNYWVLRNLEVMNQMSINEPVCWREVDTPGIIKSKTA